MRTICIASGKGGTSKTTLTADLSAWLTKGHEKQPADKRLKVAIMDLNYDQGDLSRWWGKRGRPLFPHLQELSKGFTLAQAVVALDKAGFAYCLIDTHPTDTDIVDAAIIEADATIIPIKPAERDLEDAETVVRLCRKRRKPFAFVLTQVDRRPVNKKNLEAQREAVLKAGPLLDSMLSLSNAYGQSLRDPSLSGKSGPEIDKALEADIAAIWKEVERLGVQEGAEEALGLSSKRGRK